NTVLVLISVFWVKPRDFIRNLFSREGRKLIYQAVFATPGETNHKTKPRIIATKFPVMPWG
ncbi:MAG: hypothetical protein ACM32J_05250, partial [Rhizobacter sp.]